MRERPPHRLPLLLRRPELAARRALQARRLERRGVLEEAAHVLGKAPLHRVHLRRVDQLLLTPLGHQASRRAQRLDAGVDRLLFERALLARDQERGAPLELVARQVAVPVGLRALQHVQQAGVDPLRRVLRHAQRHRQAVGAVEADPRQARDAVGVGAQLAHRVRAPGAVDARGDRRLHAAGAQEHPQRALPALVLPGAQRAVDAHAPDPRHLAQAPARGAVHDLERLQAVALVEEARPALPHVLDRAQRGDQAALGRRLHVLRPCHLEAPAVARMVAPAPVHQELLAVVQVGDRARQHHPVVLVRSLRPRGRAHRPPRTRRPASGSAPRRPPPRAPWSRAREHAPFPGSPSSLRLAPM